MNLRMNQTLFKMLSPHIFPLCLQSQSLSGIYILIFNFYGTYVCVLRGYTTYVAQLQFPCIPIDMLFIKLHATFRQNVVD